MSVKPLIRSSHNKVLGGVCGGIAVNYPSRSLGDSPPLPAPHLAGRTQSNHLYYSLYMYTRVPQPREHEEKMGFWRVLEAVEKIQYRLGHFAHLNSAHDYLHSLLRTAHIHRYSSLSEGYRLS